MKKIIFYIIPLTISLLLACSKEIALEESVFKADLDFPNLPAYTEWGYNTFGAFYDRELFIYNDKVPAKIINTGGITSFMLKGQKNYTAMSLTVELPGFSPEVYTDLVQLNDKVFDLTQPDCHVYVDFGGSDSEIQILNGELEFKRAQQLLVDTQPVKVILSGYFHFQALVDGEPISVSYGRFDVGISDNFYYY
jgi:hypothetical protein